jgi:hypothetical protein
MLSSKLALKLIKSVKLVTNSTEQIFLDKLIDSHLL